MDTLRVDICYRPLRIGWAIKTGDFNAFRKAVKYSHALWGGRFNPILFVDREEESSQLIDLFRVDVIMPVGDSEKVKDFPKKYPHLIQPFFNEHVFMKGSEHSRAQSNVLDIHNALVYLRDRPEWKEIKRRGIRYYSWNKEYPLADIFLSQLGSYPDTEDVGTDYLDLFRRSSECKEISLDSKSPIPAVMIDHPGISYLSRYGLKQHYSINRGRHYPGFFVGSVTNLEDIVCHWNLKACIFPLLNPVYFHIWDQPPLLPV